MAPPEMSLFAFTSSVANVFHIVDEMKVRGWYIQPQLAYGCSPENIHLSVNPNNVGLVEPFLADLRVAVEAAKELPSGQLVPFAEQLAAMGVEMLASADIGAMMSMVGVHDGAVPGRMAGINEFLNALPAEVSEVLLSGFFNEMFKPSP